MSLTSQYIQKTRAILDIAEQQGDAIQQAAQWFSQSILAVGWFTCLAAAIVDDSSNT